MARTIMLVHGAWVTPDCWSNFRQFFEGQGYKVEAPAWPFMDRPVAELRASPDPQLASLSIKDLVDHFDALVRAQPEPPILIGHSFGGLIVQMLLDRGLGRAGVAIDAAPPRGVLPSFTAIMAARPVLFARNGWKRVLTMPFESFARDFATTLPAAEQRAAYDRFIVPAPGRIYFQAAFGIGNAVDFSKRDRPPLMLISGSEDRTVTPSMVRAMYNKHERAGSRTVLANISRRSHWLIAEPGWQETASTAMSWAVNNA